MWYIDKEGDAYLVKDLVSLTISENFQDDATTAYDIDAKFEMLDSDTLVTLPSKEECYKFRDWFLANYLRNESIINFTSYSTGNK